MHFSRWGANLLAASVRSQFGQLICGIVFRQGSPVMVDTGSPITSTWPAIDRGGSSSPVRCESCQAPVLTDLWMSKQKPRITSSIISIRYAVKSTFKRNVAMSFPHSTVISFLQFWEIPLFSKIKLHATRRRGRWQAQIRERSRMGIYNSRVYISLLNNSYRVAGYLHGAW